MLWSELACRLSIWQWTNLQAHEVLILLVSGHFSVCLFRHLSSFGLKKESTCERLYMVLIKIIFGQPKLHLSSMDVHAKCVCILTLLQCMQFTYHIMSTCALNLMDKNIAGAIVVLQLSMDLTILDFLWPHVCINRSRVTLISLFWPKILQIFQNQGIFLCALSL